MIEANMGGAIEHWLGFQDKIGRSFMMNEDALKYPISDYLVNEGSVDLKLIELEHPHPNFSNRLVDLAILNSSKQLDNLFELKLAKTTTRYKPERQRIFNDIIRLHLAKAVTNNKCYFIITGKSINFQRDFRNYKVDKNVSGFYKKWLSFEKGNSQTFIVASESDINYQQIYQGFLDKYSDSYLGTGTTPLQLPLEITTKCEFITAFKNSVVPYLAGIWSVS